MRPDPKKKSQHNANKNAKGNKKNEQQEKTSLRKGNEETRSKIDRIRNVEEMKDVIPEQQRFPGRKLTGEKSFQDALASAGHSDSLFVTKAEQRWSNEDVSVKNKLFALDLNMLERAIACIPLHTQLDLESNFLTEENLTSATTRAEEARTSLVKKQKMVEEKRQKKTKSNEEEANSELLQKLLVQVKTSVKTDDDISENDDDVVDDSDELRPDQSVREDTEQGEDLEQWLDDFLDAKT